MNPNAEKITLRERLGFWLARDAIQAEVQRALSEGFDEGFDRGNEIGKAHLREELKAAREQGQREGAASSMAMVRHEAIREAERSKPNPTVISEVMLAKAYLGGITDGVAIAVGEPGSVPQCMCAPPGIQISSNQLWRAIDEADIVRRGIRPQPTDTPRDVEGVMLRADQMRKLLKPGG